MNLTELRDRVFRRTDWMPKRPTVDDVDGALNTVQRLFIQPALRETLSVDHSPTSRVVDLDDIATNIHRIKSIDILRGGNPTGAKIALLNAGDVSGHGARIEGDTLVFSPGVNLGDTLRFTYIRRLSPLGTFPYMGEVLEPEIDGQWHDLYWMGALAEFDNRQESRFNSRLREFRMQQQYEPRPAGWHVKPRVWR